MFRQIIKRTLSLHLSLKTSRLCKLPVCYINVKYHFVLVYPAYNDYRQYLPYFFGYKAEFFSFQNNSKNLDLLDCLGRVKLVLQQNFIGLVYLFAVTLETGETPCYSQINTVPSQCCSWPSEINF